MLEYLFSNPTFFIGWVVALVVGISVHEFAHAFSAYKLGDITAKLEGRITLNPLAHLDPLGTIMLFLVGFGWGKPVPINPYNIRYGKWGNLLTALSGPFSNLIVATIFGLTIRLLILINLPLPLLIFQFLQAIIALNLILAIFNLIPIPPLDGSKILVAIAPRSFENIMIEIERVGPLVLLGIIILSTVMNIPLFGRIILPVANAIEHFLIFWPG